MFILQTDSRLAKKPRKIVEAEKKIKVSSIPNYVITINENDKITARFKKD